MINLLTIVSVLSLQFASAQECKHHILFLPQSHDITDLKPMTSDQRREVASSQLKIARFIADNPGIPIFSEQMNVQSIHSNMFPKDELAKLREKYKKEIFPKGLPTSPQQLTELQAEKLLENGGEFIEMYRGEVTSLHKVAKGNQRDQDLWDDFEKWHKANPDTPYPPHIAKYVYGIREEMALEEIQEFFKKNPKERDVILIFGANHSFSFYPNLFPPECVIVPRSFQSQWHGRFRSGPEGFYGQNSANSYSASTSHSVTVEVEAPTAAK